MPSGAVPTVHSSGWRARASGADNFASADLMASKTASSSSSVGWSAATVRSRIRLALIMSVLIATASAGKAEDLSTPAIELQRSGDQITLKVAGASRGEVIARVLGDRQGAVKWLDNSLAEEPIKGEFRGPINKLLPALLNRCNFIISYEKEDGALMVSRVLVMGPIGPAVSDNQDDGTAATMRPVPPKSPKPAHAKPPQKMPDNAAAKKKRQPIRRQRHTTTS